MSGSGSGTFVFDFGVPHSGEYATAGSAAQTPYTVRKKVTIFTSVPGPTGYVMLPPQYGGIDLTIANRSTNPIMVLPQATDQIETYGVGVGVQVGSPGQATFRCIDPVASPAPRTWWLV